MPPGTPACTAGDLVATALGSQGATGHAIASFAFAGTGKSDCSLDGTPALTVLDGAGKALPFAEHAPFFPPEVTGPQLVSPGPVPEPHTALKYGQAGLNIDWVSQSEMCPGQGGFTIVKAVIAISGGGGLEIALPPTPEAYACQGLGVGSFESPPMPVESVPMPDLPTVKMGVPGRAVPGKPFDYLVTLTNETAQPMNLAAKCPNYEEELFAYTGASGLPLGGKHLYMLNCEPAGTLAPGASRVFQMIFNVPSDATPGDYTMVFQMGYSNAMATGAKGLVVVVKG